jgi:hypothetical protein
MIDVEEAEWKGPPGHESNESAWLDRVSSWKYEPDTPKKNIPSATPEEKQTETVCQGPPRVLEVCTTDSSTASTDNRTDWLQRR